MLHAWFPYEVFLTRVKIITIYEYSYTEKGKVIMKFRL